MILSSTHVEAVRMALSSIRAHKLRSFLTLIGIIIGVASVVVVGAGISGLNRYVVERVAKVLGANHFMIARMASSGGLSDEERERRNRRNKRLEVRDYEWIRERCGECLEVGAQADTGIDLRHGGQELLRTRIAGVTASMAVIEDKTIAQGRFILPHEVDNPAFVCVIGMDVREKFFPATDPLGKTLPINGLPMRIVGVEAARGSMFGQSFDNIVYIPLTTWGRIFGRRHSIQIHGLARESLPAAIEEARTQMRGRHRLRYRDDDDFGLVNVDEVNQGVDQFTGGIAMVVTPITLISLVVGGIVVMNIMLVSVNERTFEIGLRRAVGARRREILVQFLVESALLCALGGLLGLFLSAALSELIGATTPIPMRVTAGYVVLALLVSGTVGVVAGIYPAWRASRLDPVVALTKS
ncbi:MAG TPA: ABC transporter permease [Vicinamibacteria bacterium]